MTIEWNKVTWYSKIAAVVIFVGTFFLGFWLGTMKIENVYVEVPRVVQRSVEQNNLINTLSQTTATSIDTVGWKTYENSKNGLRFKYPASWIISYNSFSDNWFQIFIDRNPSDTKQEPDQIFGEKEKVVTSGASYYEQCHAGLCEAIGSEEIYGTSKWIHLNKPLQCGGENCPSPTSEVYRTSNNGWNYYLEFNTVEDAKMILGTLQFI